jgi:hypothetical protein
MRQALSWLLIFAAFYSGTLPADCWAGLFGCVRAFSKVRLSDDSNYLDLKTRIQAFSRLDPRQVGNDRVAREARELLKSATRHLKAKGVGYRWIQEKNGPCLVISPGPGSHFNRFARGVLKFHPGLEVRYDPARLLLTETQGAYDNFRHFLYASHESILRASPKEEVLLHETLHAKMASDQVAGKRSWRMLEAQSVQDERGRYVLPGGYVRQDTYHDYMSMDELAAYQLSLQFLTKELLELNGSSRDSKTLFFEIESALGNLREVGGRAESYGRLLLDALAAIQGKYEPLVQRSLWTGEREKFQFDHEGRRYFGRLQVSRGGSHSPGYVPNELVLTFMSQDAAREYSSDKVEFFETFLPLMDDFHVKGDVLGNVDSLKAIMDELIDEAIHAQEKADAIENLIESLRHERAPKKRQLLAQEMRRISRMR